MSGKVVGITCSTIASSDSGPRQVLNRAYVHAVENAGGIPVILPVTRDRDVIARYLGVLDGLLLTGGVDVEPAHYGEEPHPELGETDADRDATELPLIRQAVREDIPIFAICRGVQALNVALGGTLYQDLPTQKPSDIHHYQTKQGKTRSDFTHDIRILPGTRLHQTVVSDTMSTNSLHHQALKEVASILTVTAHAADGVIEAVESQTHRFLVAVQFHPEETAPYDERSRRLFQAFVEVL